MPYIKVRNSLKNKTKNKQKYIKLTKYNKRGNKKKTKKTKRVFKIKGGHIGDPPHHQFVPPHLQHQFVPPHLQQPHLQPQQHQGQQHLHSNPNILKQFQQALQQAD